MNPGTRSLQGPDLPLLLGAKASARGESLQAAPQTKDIKVLIMDPPSEAPTPALSLLDGNSTSINTTSGRSTHHTTCVP